MEAGAETVHSRNSTANAVTAPQLARALPATTPCGSWPRSPVVGRETLREVFASSTDHAEAVVLTSDGRYKGFSKGVFVRFRVLRWAL